MVKGLQKKVRGHVIVVAAVVAHAHNDADIIIFCQRFIVECMAYLSSKTVICRELLKRFDTILLTWWNKVIIFNSSVQDGTYLPRKVI